MSLNLGSDISKCPVMGNQAPPLRHTAQSALSNSDWWPNQLNIDILHQNSEKSNPLDDDFNYAEEFAKVDLQVLQSEIESIMTTSQDWWPADYGHYGPLFVRMAWHSAGTYRTSDGRGGASDGTQRFAPLNSWPDNANLDKARRLLWPIKQKYGQQLSWADLLVFAGNCALESMGFKTFGFGGGREDVWEPQKDVFWGPESEWLGDKRYTGDRELDKPLAAVQMGLIYVNPEGPNGNPDPLAAARDIRDTFGRMAMNDEETVALIAGGHSFGKTHGAASDSNVGAEPDGAPLEEMGLGWKNNYGKGNAEDTISSGLEGAWTSTPSKFSHDYFKHMFNYDWVLTKSPAGAQQWNPKDESAKTLVPDAHVAGKTHAPIMLTTDLALKEDPAYRKISENFLKNPELFEEAFSKAWYKLTHRDMGPITRYQGALVPDKELIWQDPIPTVDHALIESADIDLLKTEIANSGLTNSQLVSTAWASASTFRSSDLRGGANGARIRLAPQKYWEVNQPDQLASVIEKFEAIQTSFNSNQSNGKKVSIADLIVLGGSVGIEAAAKLAGHSIEVGFIPGRMDADDASTDVESFAVLEPTQDGFRNYLGRELDRPAPETMLDRAQLLNLTAPEMTALVGGMRVLETNVGHPDLGVFTERRGQLTNDFFVQVLDAGIEWKVSDKCEHFYEGTDRSNGELKWFATSCDLVFGSNSHLRAIAEVYGSSDGEQRFVTDFVDAWTKVMNADRFDLA